MLSKEQDARIERLERAQMVMIEGVIAAMEAIDPTGQGATRIFADQMAAALGMDLDEFAYHLNESHTARFP